MSENTPNTQNTKNANGQKNVRTAKENVIETVVEREIMPAGTPWSGKSVDVEVDDPPVPNRAHTEMKNKNKVP